MEQKRIEKWLKAILVGAALCGVLVYGVAIPGAGRSLMLLEAMLEQGTYPSYYWWWLLFLWATALPCCAAWVCAWKIAGNIGADKSFSRANAKLLHHIAALAVGDAVFFLVGNVVLLCFNRNHPSVVLFSLLVVFLGVAIAVAAAALSHLVMRAAELQDQSDWTI